MSQPPTPDQRPKQVPQASNSEVDQRYMRQLAAVAEVGRAITSSLDLNTLLRVLVDVLRNTFGYYGVNVWLLTEPPDITQLKAGISATGVDLSQLEIQYSMQVDNLVTRACRSEEPALENHTRFSAGSQASLSEHFPNARSAMVLPLRMAQKAVGALEILSDQEQAFSAEDITLLRSISDQATIAIRNATLYESERSRRHLAETLQRVGRAISGTLELNEVLALILRLLDEIVPTDRSAVMLLNQDANELEFVATRGFPGTTPAEIPHIKLKEDNIYGRVFRSQQPISLPDVQEYPGWQELQILAPARSWMGVPLIQSEQVIGMLSLARETLHPYTVSEVTLAQTFADQAAVALENARLYDNLARFSHQLREMVQQRTQELQRAYEQLERLDRTKSDFIRVTSHELRTPLTVLHGYSQMLLQDQDVMNSSKLRPLAQGIVQGAVRLHEIVNAMLDIAKIDSSALELSPEPVPTSYLIKNIVSNFESALEQRNLNLEISSLSSLPPIEVDAPAISKVFKQIISNAIKYTPDGGKITITGQEITRDSNVLDGASGIQITIRDTGIGIDPAFHELIFTKFYQTGEVALHSSSKTRFKGGGAGLGLAIARGIVQAHHGKLWVESPGHDETNCPGSQFHVVLPLRQPPS